MGIKIGYVRQVLAADDKEKRDAWRRQAEALGATHYRVSLIDRNNHSESEQINFGKLRAEGVSEYLYSAAEVEELIPRLRRHNALASDIYVTPIDQAHHYMIIDDMKPGALKRLESLGFTPCLVQSSGKGNELSVIKVRRFERPDELALAYKAVRALNIAFGDSQLSVAMHRLRMAGFSNKKAGRDGAPTRTLFASHRICHIADDLLQQLRHSADTPVMHVREQSEQAQIEIANNLDMSRDRYVPDTGLRLELPDYSERRFHIGERVRF